MALLSGLGTGKILSATRAHNIPEAVIKGMGNAIIINRVNALLGNPLGAVGLSFTLPVVGIQVTPFTVLNYFLLNGFQLKFDLNALIGAIAAVFAGANPTGSMAFQSQNPERRTGGVAYNGL